MGRIIFTAKRIVPGLVSVELGIVLVFILNIQGFFYCLEVYIKNCILYKFDFVTQQFYSDPRAAVVHLYFRAGSTFPVPHAVCTVSPGHWANKADTQ